MGEKLEVDKRILKFISQHKVMSLAVKSGDDLWCFNALYVYDKINVGFIVTSSVNTRHIAILDDANNYDNETNIVAGTIVLETNKVGVFRGLQFRARMTKEDNSLNSPSRLMYLKRFPFAILNDSDLWRLELQEMKYTDNRLGFGTKILWAN